MGDLKVELNIEEVTKELNKLEAKVKKINETLEDLEKRTERYIV
jgi:hypothetical protein